MAAEMDMKCLICDDVVVDDYSQVGEKGILGLVRASILRSDGKRVVFNDKKSGFIQKSCRKVYTRPDSIKSALRETGNNLPSTSQDDLRLRSTDKKVNLKSNCLFCEECIDDEFQEQQKKDPKTCDKRYTKFELCRQTIQLLYEQRRGGMTGLTQY